MLPEELNPSIQGDTMVIKNTETKVRYDNEFLQLRQVLAPPHWPSGISHVHNRTVPHYYQSLSTPSPTLSKEEHTSDDRGKDLIHVTDPTTDDDSKPSEGGEADAQSFYDIRLDPAKELRENILEKLSAHNADRIAKRCEHPGPGPFTRREKNPVCIIDPNTGRDIFANTVSNGFDTRISTPECPKSGRVKKEKRLISIVDPATGCDISKELLLKISDAKTNDTNVPETGHMTSREKKLMRIVDPATGCDITDQIFSNSAEEKDADSKSYFPTTDMASRIMPFSVSSSTTGSILCVPGGQHLPSTNRNQSTVIPHTSSPAGSPNVLWLLDGHLAELTDSEDQEGKEQTIPSEDSVRGHAEADNLPYPVQESQMGVPQTTCPIAHINPGLQWMAKDIKALRDQLQHQPSHPVIIAVLDSGIYEHPDLQGMILASKNFVPRNDDDVVCQEEDLTQDSHNHGTMVAGILWQIAGNCTKILNLKVLRNTGTGSLSYIRRALYYIEQWDEDHPDEKVDIILISLGTGQYDKRVSRLLGRLGEDKVIIAAAANDGNIKAETITFPAKHPYVIAIGSCDNLGNRCSHSSKGQELSFLFPGTEIQSTSSLYRLNGDAHRFAKASGTSLAAPHCAGIAALLIVLIERSLGAEKRTLLTSSYHIKNILRDKNVCGRTPTVDDGYGMPDISRISEASFHTYLKEHVEFRE